MKNNLFISGICAAAVAGLFSSVLCSCGESVPSSGSVEEAFMPVVLVEGGTVNGSSDYQFWGNTAFNGVFTEGRTVEVKSFYMGRREVTKAQYMSVLLKNDAEDVYTADPSCSSHNASKSPLASGEVDSNRPVENVTWYDAAYFCNLLSEQEGLEPVYDFTVPVTSFEYLDDTFDPDYAIVHYGGSGVTVDETADGWRLPTEVEWEYASRGGDPSADEWMFEYAGADSSVASSSESSGDTVLGEYAWYLVNCQVDGSYVTHECGKKKCSRLGFFDMSGNVLEWCQDWYSDSIDSSTPVSGPSSGKSHVVRGGRITDNASECSVAYRTCTSTDTDHNSSIGFRVVRSAICP